MKIFFDEGCRGDPPAIEVAVVVGGTTTVLPGLGGGSSSDAEWLARIHAATRARSPGASDLVLIGSSADVIVKANGTAPCRGNSVLHPVRFRAARASLTRLHVRRVKRSHDLAGSLLARRCA